MASGTQTSLKQVEAGSGNIVVPHHFLEAGIGFTACLLDPIVPPADVKIRMLVPSMLGNSSLPMKPSGL